MVKHFVACTKIVWKGLRVQPLKVHFLSNSFYPPPSSILPWKKNWTMVTDRFHDPEHYMSNNFCASTYSLEFYLETSNLIILRAIIFYQTFSFLKQWWRKKILSDEFCSWALWQKKLTSAAHLIVSLQKLTFMRHCEPKKQEIFFRPLKMSLECVNHCFLRQMYF